VITVTDDARLERMEKKLDTLSEAVVSLARMEERMITLFKRMDKYDDVQTGVVDRVEKVEKITVQRGVVFHMRVEKVEKITVQRGVVFHMLDKLFWVAVGAGVALVVKLGGQ